MPTTIDSRFESLGLAGFDGAISDRLQAWLLYQLPPGWEGAQVSDLWADLFDSAAIPPGAHNERLAQWYRLQGATGSSLPDLAHDYWVNQLETGILNDHRI
jgi:hypothetical protein